MPIFLFIYFDWGLIPKFGGTHHLYIRLNRAHRNTFAYTLGFVYGFRTGIHEIFESPPAVRIPQTSVDCLVSDKCVFVCRHDFKSFRRFYRLDIYKKYPGKISKSVFKCSTIKPIRPAADVCRIRTDTSLVVEVTLAFTTDIVFFRKTESIVFVYDAKLHPQYAAFLRRRNNIQKFLFSQSMFGFKSQLNSNISDANIPIFRLTANY